VPKNGLVKPLIKTSIKKYLNEKLLGLVEDPRLLPFLKPMDLLFIGDRS
jgi:hypothetical protein